MNRHAKASSAGSTRHMAGEFSPCFRGTGASSRHRHRLLLCSVLVALGALLSIFAAGASATLTRDPEPFSPLDGSSIGLTLHELSGIAVDETTGNVFTTDGRDGLAPGEGVAILSGEGGPPVGLVSPFKVPGTSFFEPNAPTFLVYDNSSTSPVKGTLYTFNNTLGTIKKYIRNAGTETYEEVSGGDITVSGCGNGAGGGIDSEGNVYFGCSSLPRIYVFSPTGALLHEYDLSSTPVNSPGQIAVDNAGDLFVQQQGDDLYKFPANGSGEIDPATNPPVATSLATPVSHVTGVAYDPTTNRVLGALSDPGRVVEFDATTLARLGEFGRGVLGSRPERVSLNPKTHRAYVVDYFSKNIAVFGPDLIIPTPTAGTATNITGSKATLNGTVNPEGIEVTECFFEYGLTTSYGSKTTDCEGEIPTDSEDHAVSAKVSGLTPNGVTYHYRLVAKNENGTERSADRTLVTGKTVITEAATGVGTSDATLHGTLRPEGVPFSVCKFEYKLTTGASFEDEAACVPSASSIEADFEEHAVSASASGLQSNSTYEFRLSGTNAQGTVAGEIFIFTTVGPPQITEIRALNASQSAATIEGRIDPSGFGTSYRFEWGSTTSYGNEVPVDFEPFIGSGNEPVRVSAKLNGLSAATTYHYRIVATSSAGTTASPDQVVETLNSCGLPEGRCFELVSRREAGPVAIPGELVGSAEMHYQAATEGSGKFAYPVEAGYPDSTKGAEVLYRGTRGPSGWDSIQLSTPIVDLNEQNGGDSGTGPVQWLSDDLSCGFAESFQPLTDDPTTRLAREYGGSNLYRINPDGSYTAVSNLAPENPEIAAGGRLGFYEVAGASQDCSKVLFESAYRYPGIPGSGLYEWDEGTLRNVGSVPGPSGEVVVGARAGTGAGALEDSQNTVSEGGSRVFFSATRQTSPNPAEIGKTGIFVREDGTITRDLSLSETSTPAGDATYQWANPDGSKVFFTANAGLTDESSPEGTDLYVYDLESEELTDLTPYQRAGGAQVAGILGITGDGSRVYFASRNQLVPGRGSSLAENQSANTFSIYGVSNGEFSYVGRFSDHSSERWNVLIERQREWTSRVSPDGRYLLFQSSADVTGYDSGGVPEAYLYDSQGGSEGTLCVSCRQDGKPSVAPTGVGSDGLRYDVLPVGEAINNTINGPQFLTMRGGEPQVFFSSPDRLAPGAVEHQNNIYEWSHGQVFRLVSAREGQQSPHPFGGHFAAFGGASADGSDVYVVTPETLNWEDGDERLSAYDVRIGGGFPEPPAPPAPCEATTEGSCQGPAQGGPSVPGAASAAFNGPGNPAPAGEKKQKKAHKKKSHKKKGHAKKHKRANNNRRAGK